MGVEVMHMEANSISLGTGLDNAYQRLAQLDLDDGPFGLPKPDNAFDGATPLPKKTPSEPDLQVGDDDRPNWQVEEPPLEMSGIPALFTCTVNRKATRAAYHLSDTNDVAF